MNAILYILAIAILIIATYHSWRLIKPTQMKLTRLSWLSWSPWLLIFLAQCILILLTGFELARTLLVPPFTSWMNTVISICSVLVAICFLAGNYGFIPRFLGIFNENKSLQKEQDILQPIFENDPNPLILKDRQSVYVTANPAFGKLMNSQDNLLTGKTDLDFFASTDAEAFRQEEESLMVSGNLAVTERELKLENEPRWLRFTRIPLRKPGAEISGVLVSIQDITQARKVIPLNESIQKLGLLNEAAISLLSNLDFRSLPANILTWAQRLTGSTSGVVCLINADNKTMEVRAATGKMEPALGKKLRAGEGLVGKTWQSTETIQVNSADMHFADTPASFKEFFGQKFNAAIGVPLRYDSQIVGVIGLFQTEAGKKIEQTGVQVLNHYSALVAAALELVYSTNAIQKTNQDSRRTIDSLQDRVKFEHLVALIATYFINLEPGKIDQGIEHALETIGKYAKVDHGYLFFFPGEKTKKSVVYEWSGKGTGSQYDYMLRMDSQGSSWLLGKLARLETIVLSDLDNLPVDASELGQSLRAQGIKSLTAIPLVSNREVIGYFGLDTIDQSIKWSEGMMPLLKIAAEIFVNALERKWAGEALNVSRDRMARRITTLEQNNLEGNLITEMGNLLQACRTADEAYPIISKYLSKLIPKTAGSLYMIRTGEDAVERVIAWGEGSQGGGEHEVALNECWGLRRGRIYLVTDTGASPLCNHLSEPLPAVYLCAPLIAQGETVGLLHLRSEQQADSVSAPVGETPGLADQLDLAAKIVEHLAPALSNLNLRDKLRSQAIRDPLTGLFNRRYMEVTLEREIRRASRHATTVGAMMFDIDHMKPINDTLGHDAGDYVLRELGGLMLKIFRGEDVACRYGGDEFTVILPEANLADIWQRAEQLRDAFKKLHLELEGRTIAPVTLSIGVAVFPDHGTTAERLLQSSDIAAYLAKSEGGDRVMIARSNDE